MEKDKIFSEKSFPALNKLGQGLNRVKNGLVNLNVAIILIIAFLGMGNPSYGSNERSIAKSGGSITILDGWLSMQYEANVYAVQVLNAEEQIVTGVADCPSNDCPLFIGELTPDYYVVHVYTDEGNFSHQICITN